MKVRPHERAWFEAICAGAAAQDKLVRTELTLDGTPVAMLASFRAGAGLYTFKIAFDETYARFSPGTLLMLKGIGAFLRDGRTEWVDSCAIPGHPMVDHIWAQRRTMRSVTIATRHRAVPAFPFMECCRDASRRARAGKIARSLRQISQGDRE